MLLKVSELAVTSTAFLLALERVKIYKQDKLSQYLECCLKF